VESRADLRALLDDNGIALKKRWGQNFLVDPVARDRILATLGLGSHELVWEIGGGAGALTLQLADRCGHLVVFEIDHGLVRLLRSRLEGGRSDVVAGDFLKTHTPALRDYGAPDLVVGNLPYRSASQIIAALASGGIAARRCVLTVQRELGERMVARPRTKAYSSFTVLCQAAFNVRTVGDLGAGSFYPTPRVSSRIVALEPRVTSPSPDLRSLQAITRLLFSTRRKTIRHTVHAAQSALADSVRLALDAMGVDPERRPEELDVACYMELSRHVRAAGSPSDPGSSPVEQSGDDPGVPSP
jgi:16S rRNA (adenine1518-N6/adenine1519-N6)-dimethyltransferase